MINLQNPIIPAPTQAIEIDKLIYQTQMLLDTNLDWLTHGYGRAYRFIEKVGQRIYMPEIYIGDSSYYRVTPDNDKKGTCFFVVGKEENKDYQSHLKNNLTYEVGIVFWVNLKLINETLLGTEIFTQNLIRDVRRVLTQSAMSIKLKTVEREFKEVYKEFNLDETNDYLRAPYDGFRFNLEVVVGEDCGAVSFNPLQALLNNLSEAERIAILQSIDFSNAAYYNALTAQQKTDLGI